MTILRSLSLFECLRYIAHPSSFLAFLTCCLRNAHQSCQGSKEYALCRSSLDNEEADSRWRLSRRALKEKSLHLLYQLIEVKTHPLAERQSSIQRVTNFSIVAGYQSRT